MKISMGIKNSVAERFFQDCLVFYQSYEALSKIDYLATRFSFIRLRLEKFVQMMKSAKATVSLEDSDLVRDGDFRNLMAALRGYAALPIPAKSEAAKILLEIIDRHGGSQIVFLPFNEESGVIDSIEEEFSRSKEKIDTLEGVGELSSKLFESNKTVEELFRQNTRSSAASESEMSAHAIKKELISYFNAEIVPYLEMMKKLEPDTYSAFASDISKAISQANATAPKRDRSSKSESNK